MDLSRGDLVALCEGMTREQVDRVHWLLHEWSTGPEDSFPVQLSLLTLAQLRAAASVPRSITDSRKWLEQQLADYRRQTQSLMESFNQTMQIKIGGFETALSSNAKTIENAANQIQAQLDVAEEVAGRVKSLMANATSQSEHVRARAAVECDRLHEISNDLQDRIAWRVMLRWSIFFLLISAISVLAGHYLWKP